MNDMKRGVDIQIPCFVVDAEVVEMKLMFSKLVA
jgi:hypothetical protein